MKRPANKVRLNDLVIKHLKKKDKPYLIWDTKQRGLAIRVEPTGFASYKCIYSRHGRPRWYSIGPVDVIDLTDARTEAGKVLVQVAEGKDPQADRRAERTSGTFEDLANRYREYAKKKNKSWKQADNLVNRHLLPRWGKLKPADIARSDVKTMMGRIAAPIVANQVLASASAIFAWGIREELVKVNPCVGVERNPTTSRERVLSDSEIPKFWKGFEAADLVRGMALKMILLTGQRPGEVTRMRTEHIEDGWWTLPGAPIPSLGWPGTKNGETHRVWLPAPARKILDEMDSEGWVFVGPRGKPIDKLEVVMKDIYSNLKVERVTPHDLRRTHGTTITSLGFGTDAMNRIQNHKEGGIASVYDRHQYADENKRIMEAVANKIMSLVSGKSADNVVGMRSRKKRV